MSRQQKVVVRTTSVPQGWAPGVEPRSVHGGYQAMNPKAWRAALLTTPGGSGAAGRNPLGAGEPAVPPPDDLPEGARREDLNLESPLRLPRRQSPQVVRPVVIRMDPAQDMPPVAAAGPEDRRAQLNQRLKDVNPLGNGFISGS